MTTTLRDALTERINQVGPAHPDIEELVGLGEQRLRRRRLAALAGAGAAVALAIALAIGGTSLIRSADQNPGPADHPPTNPDKTPTITPTTTRPIVYTDDAFSARCRAAGQGRRGFCFGILQVGDRAVRIDQALHQARYWPMYVTDAGAVYGSADGVWFTDGSAPRQIAQHICLAGATDAKVTTGSAGPLAVWVDCTAEARGDLVVFDTGSGREVARAPIPGCRAAETKRFADIGCRPVAVIAGHVYFARAGVSPDTPVYRLLRLDVVTGDVVAATRQMYARDLSSDRRALVVGDSWRTGARETEVDFDVVGSRLVPTKWSQGEVQTETRAFDIATGRPVRLRLPAGYHPGPPPLFPGDSASGVRQFKLFEWLDDDTVALAQLGDNGHMGDIITCRLSDGACHLVAKAPLSVRLVVGHLY
jgi:hypothetical protein